MARPWGKCNADCGAGTQYRSVQCVRDTTQTVVSASLCAAGDRLPSSQACNAGDCSAPFYKFGEWSKCSATCGGGTSSRTVECFLNSATKAASAADCVTAGLSAATATRTCNNFPCYSVRVGALSPCSASCGGGTRTRDVKCMHYLGTEATVADCTGFGLKVPAATVACNTKPCVAPSFCSTTQCSTQGTCNTATQACDCYPGRSGDHCEVAPDCAGMQAPDGTCCPAPGVLDISDGCCASGVLDKDGNCCAGGATAKLNPCGECTTTGAAPEYIDFKGACCAVEQLAGNGVCCDGEVDMCGVCDGLNYCPVTQQAAMATA